MGATLKEKWVNTRKIHYCHGCLRKFPPKTLMYYWVGICDNFWSIYWCKTCFDVSLIINKDGDYDDGFDEGFVTNECNRNESPEDLLKRLINE